MVTTFRPISRPIWRAATYLSSMAASSRSPITRAISPPSISIPAAISRSTSCSPIRATSRPQPCMNHWASSRWIRPAASPSRSTSAAKPACPASMPPATSPRPSCPRSPRRHRRARWRVSSPSNRCWFECIRFPSPVAAGYRQKGDPVVCAAGDAGRQASSWSDMSVLELKVPPPIVALVLALLMWLTPAVAGLVQIPYPARVLCAVFLLCIGQVISIAGMVAFRRAKTTVNPVKASLASSLVIQGVYRYTRNPMYVGLLLTLLAWALFLANPFAVPWVVVYVLYITRFQIIPEERALASLFGAEYEAYKGRVRRWV